MKESVDLEEGKMKQLHMYIDQKKPMSDMDCTKDETRSKNYKSIDEGKDIW